jgi:hypothetical protein
MKDAFQEVHESVVPNFVLVVNIRKVFASISIEGAV